MRLALVETLGEKPLELVDILGRAALQFLEQCFCLLVPGLAGIQLVLFERRDSLQLVAQHHERM
jgi:hypothetical protein